jgi:hypothetical protein
MDMFIEVVVFLLVAGDDVFALLICDEDLEYGARLSDVYWWELWEKNFLVLRCVRFSYFVSQSGVLIVFGQFVTGFMSITGELLYASRSCTVRVFFSMFSSLHVVSAILLGLLGVLVANAPTSGSSGFPVGCMCVWKLLFISWSWNITSM